MTKARHTQTGRASFGPAPRGRRLLALALGLVLWITPLRATPLCAAQESRPQQPAPREEASKEAAGKGDAANVVVASNEDYRIGPNDVLDVKVVNAPELSGTFVVSAAGVIPMPYIGDMKVAQKTPHEVAAMIADGLRGDYLKNPRVSVNVTQYNSRSFFIQGAVRNPGVYQIKGTASLLKLITVAGGLSDNHGSRAFVIREKATEMAAAGAPAAEGDQYDLKLVNINSLLKGDFENNVVIEPGDIINIPPLDVFYVAGEVRKPGSFPLKEGTTLRQAISLAQGTTFEAARDRGVIFREDQKGKRTDIKVDVAAVMAGKKDDLEIMANDIIIIPNSRSRAIGGALLKAFGLSTIQRGVIY